MKSEEDIKFVCEKLKCSREDVLVLHDASFEQVVRILTVPQKSLTKKEREWAEKVAKDYLNNKIIND